MFAEAAQRGYRLSAGDLGENITTKGVPLLDLPVGTRLRIGEVVIRLTGLRNPCSQINDFRPGLLKVMVERADGVATASDPTLTANGGADRLDGKQIRRKAGVMGVIEHGGEVRPGDAIEIELPSEPHTALEPV